MSLLDFVVNSEQLSENRIKLRDRKYLDLARGLTSPASLENDGVVS